GAAAEATVAQINARGGKAIAVEADVSQPDSVQRLVRRTLEAFSEVHTLLNNAAIQVNKTVEDTTVEEWNRELSVNVGGVFLCSKFFVSRLGRQKGMSSVCSRSTGSSSSQCVPATALPRLQS